MRRGDVTVDEMSRRGWKKPFGWDYPEGNKEFRGYDLEKYLELIRKGAEVKVTQKPDNGNVYIRNREDADSCAYYTRYHTEEYHIEYIWVKVGGRWKLVLEKDVVEGRYKTSGQAYCGD